MHDKDYSKKSEQLTQRTHFNFSIDILKNKRIKATLDELEIFENIFFYSVTLRQPLKFNLNMLLYSFILYTYIRVNETVMEKELHRIQPSNT